MGEIEMVDLSSGRKAQLTERVPPLENGDRLTSYEFERRYGASGIKKAELIEGVVYVAAALRFGSHAEPHGNLVGWLWTYKTATPNVRLGIEPTVRLDEDNQPQPDGVLLLPASAGGQARLSEDDYVEGSPELVAEVAASRVAIDLNMKKTAYRRNGVQEYVVWQVFENELKWFRLQNSDYILLTPDEQGIIKSQVFPGLWLAVSALLQGEMQQVLEVLQMGMRSPEHEAFVQQLR